MDLQEFGVMALAAAAGVIVAGLIMSFGSDLPIIKDARNGFDI